MEPVGRIHGTGTFDHSTRKWKVRTKEITASATIGQLRQRYGHEVPDDERRSRPYWTRYLVELKQQHHLVEAADRLAAAKLCGHEPGPYSDFTRTAQGDIGPRKELAPEVVRLVNAASQGRYDEITATLAPPAPPVERLKHEINVYLDRHRQKNHKGHYDIRAALDLFVEACGDISFRDTGPQHYRKFLDKLDATKWSARTRVNRQRMVHTFLKRLEADYNLVFGFIRNPDYRREAPEGRKVQYSIEQVRTALQHTRGIDRTALLLGLNAGMYWGDIIELKAEHVTDTHIVKGRAKNKKRAGQVVGSWLLWPQTADAIEYGHTKWQLENSYSTFRKAYNLPEHKALRKFAAQWIHDNVGETEARLYRGEGVGGTHGRHYIKNYTPEQVVKLDRALTLLWKAISQS